MKFTVLKNQVTRNIRDALRRSNYSGFRDPNTGQESFIRRLSRTQFYPRYHLYITDLPEVWEFNLHLDQKQVRYEGQTAHNADYEGQEIEEEAGRILSSLG